MGTATIDPATGTRPGLAPPPGPSPREAGRWLLRLQEDPLNVFSRLTRRYGKVTMLNLGVRRAALVSGPDATRHVLVANQDNYRKSEQYAILEPVLGKGLVTSSGALWQRQRRLVAPVFAKRHLTPFADHMAAAASDALDEWETRWPDGTRIELAEEILHIGLDTVGRALVGHDFVDQASAFGKALGVVLHEAGAISRSPAVFAGQELPGVGIRRAASVTTPQRWRRLLREAGTMTGVIDAVIADRERHGHGDRDDLLRLLMETVDEETGRRMDARQLRDELLTFVAAGHETTAHGLAWMGLLLSQNPAARDRLEAEVDEVLGGRVPTAADADRLPWTTACFQEAMRIYPPVWHVQRVAIADDVIGGYAIPAGTTIFVSIWDTHRDPDVWENPAGFDPRRWLDDAPKSRPRFSYLPFGGGRRVCIGQGFAMLNATILAASIAQRFRFDADPGWRIALDPTVTIRPLYGIPVTVHRR